MNSLAHSIVAGLHLAELLAALAALLRSLLVLAALATPGLGFT